MPLFFKKILYRSKVKKKVYAFHEKKKMLPADNRRYASGNCAAGVGRKE